MFIYKYLLLTLCKIVNYFFYTFCVAVIGVIESKVLYIYAARSQWRTIWITLYDLRQLHVERVGVTSCHLHM